MIGKITIGKSFRGCLLYVLNDKLQHSNEAVMKGRAEVILYNQCYGTDKELIGQFNEVRRLNPRLSKPVLHIILSLAPGEELSRDKLMELSEACAKELGFEHNQYVAALHKDTDHSHLHIVANRIGFDGRTVSDSRNYQKIATFCRQMEAKYGLQQVLSPRRFLPRSQRLQPRTDKRKEAMKKDVGDALRQSRSYAEFESRMRAKGYEVIKGRGISFTDEKKVSVKGSELGYSLATIERLLQQQAVQVQQPTTVHQAIKEPTANQQHKPVGTPLNREEIPGGGVLQELLKPENVPDQPDAELLKKKRKRKRQSRHL